MFFYFDSRVYLLAFTIGFFSDREFTKLNTRYSWFSTRAVLFEDPVNLQSVHEPDEEDLVRYSLERRFSSLKEIIISMPEQLS